MAVAPASHMRAVLGSGALQAEAMSKDTSAGQRPQFKTLTAVFSLIAACAHAASVVATERRRRSPNRR